MHIVFITGEYPPMQGGVGAYTAELGAALVELGVQVSVLTSVHAATSPGQAVEIRRGVHIYPQRRRWGPALWEAAYRLAGEDKADWLHIQYQTAAYGMNPAVNLAPWLWRKWSRERWHTQQGLRMAWTYHDLLVPYLFPKAGDRLRQWITRLPARLVDLPIVTNEGDRLALAAQGIDAAKSPIGSNIAARTFAPDQIQALRTGYGYSPRDIVIGYFGFLNRSKGGLTLVDTLERLVRDGLPAHLLMIGERVGASDPTNYAYLQEVEAAIDAQGLADRVQWTGRLEDAQVSAALAVCDVLLMPYTDGVSLRRGTLMAGLAHGCAVITTHPTAPLPELVDGEHVCYIPPDDAPAAAAAVRRMLEDPAWAAHLRAGARAVSQQFTWEAIARQHLDLYGSHSTA